MSPHLFGNIYTQYYKKAHSFVNHYICNEEASEDIVSEALLKVWKEMNAKEIADIRPLLITILRNKSFDYLRHEQVRQIAFDELSGYHREELRTQILSCESSPSLGLFSDEIHHILMRTLTLLPCRTRRIFEMVRFEKLSYSDVAGRVGISVKGVDYHVTKAQKELRIALKDYL